MIIQRVCAVAVGILTIGLGSAQATPLTWDLSNVAFSDGTVVTGSFVFDADTDIFGVLNISTSGGTSVPAQSTWFYGPCATCLRNDVFSGFLATDNLFADQTGNQFVSLFGSIGAPMTNAGGVITLDVGIVGTCGDPMCDTLDAGLPNSSITSGQFVSRKVPEPATLLLTGSGIAVAVRARRRRARAPARATSNKN